MTETKSLKRKELLIAKEKSKLGSGPLVFSSKFNPHVKRLKRAITKHWHILMKDPEAKLVFDKKPIFAFGRYKNLKDILTSAVLN